MSPHGSHHGGQRRYQFKYRYAKVSSYSRYDKQSAPGGIFSFAIAFSLQNALSLIRSGMKFTGKTNRLVGFPLEGLVLVG